jgi:hypothetical protein
MEKRSVKSQTGQTGAVMSTTEREGYEGWLQGQGERDDYRPSSVCTQRILQVNPQMVLQIPADLIGQTRQDEAIPGFVSLCDILAEQRHWPLAVRIQHANVEAASA